jgi:hypothetical protein
MAYLQGHLLPLPMRLLDLFLEDGALEDLADQHA